MKPPLIAIDMGGTIEDSWESKRLWFDVRGFDLGQWPRSREEIIEHIGGQEALYERMAAEVYTDANILGRKPIEGAAAGVRTLARQFRVAILSSRTDSQRLTTATWLRLHGLEQSISEIVLIGANSNKLEWCENAGAVVLIDDDVRHLEPTTDCQTTTRIHFCASPRCPRPLNDDVLVANTWPGILSLLQSERVKLRCQSRMQLQDSAS